MSAPAPPYARTYQRYDEQVIPGKRLGRQIMRDSRSAAYPFKARRTVPVVSVEHERHSPILDQADLGSCEGNAEVGCVSCSPHYEALPPKTVLNEQLAVLLYSKATSLDGFAGAYPPTDTGTDSTSVNKAAQQAGLIGGYTHAATLTDLLQALMAGAVNVAFSWYDSFDDPDANGLITIGQQAGIRGGHALCARKVDAVKRWIWLDNSWTLKWGVDGRCAVDYATMERLLAEDGEAVVPVPLSAPAPEPVPVPPPTDATLAAYLADEKLIAWAAARHIGANGYAAVQYQQLRANEAVRSL